MNDIRHMNHCLELAQLGMGNVAPNPMVGSILVYEDKIIGEGYHQRFGGAHAEVNCIQSVREENIVNITKSTLYVSLEPCCHFGKTPPCTDLIIKSGIKKVVIASVDPNPKVSGKGIEKLTQNGVQVEVGILDEEQKEINKRFYKYFTENRPFVILKWAESANGMISNIGERTKISSEESDLIVHQWRSQEQAILIGTNTALIDNPNLTTRLVKGKHPIRAVIDRNLKIPLNFHIFDTNSTVLVINSIKEATVNHIEFLKTEDFSPQSIVKILFEYNIQSVIIEGGSKIINSFIEAGIWDEARIIKSKLIIENGLIGPKLTNYKLMTTSQLTDDHIEYYTNDYITSSKT